jgi:hypothetical protein
MPSHFSSIGMPVESVEDMSKLLEIAVKNSEKISCEFGCYSKWTSTTSAELWIQIDKMNKIVGVNLFYDGDSNFYTGIIKKIDNDKYNDFERLFYAWANPQDNDPEDGIYPFAFDCVNFLAVKKFELPCIKNIKLSAFAHEIKIYLNEDDFYSKQEEKPGFASKAFIPSGLFSPNYDDTAKEIIPEAIFTGIVLDFKELKNELTEKIFYWIKTDTLGGIIDAVVDPELINNKININGIISGQFYLCGKIIE